VGVTAGLSHLRDEVFDAVLVSHEPGVLDALDLVEGLRAGGNDEPMIVLGAAPSSQMSSVRQDWDRTMMSVDLTVDQARSGGFERDRDAAPSGSLRSVKESTGYHLQATNGEIGHVDDYLIRQENMRIPYLLVDTSNWIGGRSVIVSSEALDRVDNDRGLLYVEATRDAIRDAPSLDSIDSAIHTLETGPPFTII
jgi:hypothetical protein